MLQKQMEIVKCANGWALILPETYSQQEAVAQMMENLPGAIKSMQKDDDLSELQKPRLVVRDMYIPNPMQYVNSKIHVFLSFRELMAFIELSFDQVNE